MWIYNLLLCCFYCALITAVNAYQYRAGAVSSSGLNYKPPYNYPAPTQEFNEGPLAAASSVARNYQARTQLPQLPQLPQFASASSSYAATRQQQPTYAQVQQQISGYQRAPSAVGVHQQQQQQQQQQQHQYTAPSNVVKQFTSPALENAAFNMALTSQGYSFGSGAAAAITSPSAAASAPNVASPALSTSSSTDPYSLNVKLPLPFNVVPIKSQPLPLQSGAPFDAVPRSLTSYGTVHPQRR